MPRRVKNGRPKHKIKTTRYQELLDSMSKSVRSRVLQKLLILDFVIFECPRELSPQRQDIQKRLLAKRKNDINMNVCDEMTLEEVMEILKVSRRTAMEYKIALTRLKS
jgi:hypothetical protein